METQRLIKSQFKQLHQVLDQEESASIAAVKKEEEEKIAGMKDKIKELSAEVLSIADTISVIEGQLQEDEMVFLKVCIAQNTSTFSLSFLKLPTFTMNFFIFQNFKDTQDR